MQTSLTFFILKVAISTGKEKSFDHLFVQALAG